MKIRAVFLFSLRARGPGTHDACRVYSSWLRMAPRVPSEPGSLVKDGVQHFVRILSKMASCPRDEDGHVCFMRGKHSWTHRALHQKASCQQGLTVDAQPLCRNVEDGAERSVRNGNRGRWPSVQCGSLNAPSVPREVMQHRPIESASNEGSGECEHKFGCLAGLFRRRTCTALSSAPF